MSADEMPSDSQIKKLVHRWTFRSRLAEPSAPPAGRPTTRRLGVVQKGIGDGGAPNTPVDVVAEAYLRGDWSIHGRCRAFRDVPSSRCRDPVGWSRNARRWIGTDLG